MGKGSRELSPDWANEKADEACSLLRWLAARGFRREFNVETRTVRTPLGELREVRIGRAKGGRDPGRVTALPDEHKGVGVARAGSPTKRTRQILSVPRYCGTCDKKTRDMLDRGSSVAE